MRKINLSKHFTQLKVEFENCESIVIPANRVERLYIDGIKKNLTYVHRSHYNKRIIDLFDDECEFVSFDIELEGISEYRYEPSTQEYPLGMFTNTPVSNKVIDRPNILGRILHYNDITHLSFLDDNDKTLYTLLVPFDGEYPETNDYMNVQVEEWGKLRMTVVIDGNKKIG